MPRNHGDSYKASVPVLPYESPVTEKFAIPFVPKFRRVLEVARCGRGGLPNLK